MKDSEPGAAKQSAKWLFETVGEGNIFTYAQLRAAVPRRSQVDRRKRQLSDVGWVIHSSKDDSTLKVDEHRLVEVGDKCWEPGYHWPSKSTVSKKVRRDVFDRDGNRCVVCGIAAGERYPDDATKTARLTIGHLLPKGRKGTNAPDNLRTECALCNETSRHLTASPVDPGLLKAQIRELGRKDRADLRQWIGDGRRSFTRVEALWAKYRQLPASVRDEVEAFIDALP